MRSIPRFPLRRSAMLAGLALTLGLAACTTTPPTPPVAQSPKATPDGTVTVFHRKSSGGMGVFDGKVEWVQRAGTWQGQPAVALVSQQAGTTLHAPDSLGMLATLATNGNPLFSYHPHITYPWPMSVGKTLTTNHTVTVHATGATLPMRIDWRVESWGDVTVPAGTFKAYKVVFQMSNGDLETRWVSPEPGLGTIKRQVVRSANHPQGPGELNAELLSLQLPGR